MNLDISASVEDAESIHHGKQKSKGARAEAGPYLKSTLRSVSKALSWMRWAVPLLVLLVFAPLGAQAQSALDGFDPGANAEVRAFAVQADGKILVGGDFTTLGGGGFGTTVRNYIGRLNADGSLDTSFNPGANGFVNAIAVQADGKILIGGRFTFLGGGGFGTTARNYIGRLNADGSLDTSFDPGANSYFWAIAVQADGKILVGGEFTTLGGGGIGTTTRNRIGRLNADGSLDSSFNPGANWNIDALAVQPDGKILVGGWFTTLGGGSTGTTTRNRIGRLNADGSLDTSFNPGANSYVYAIAVQVDGRILVGGAFTTLGGGGTGTTARARIGRLNADGSLDASFNPGANSTVLALAVQPDGKILAGGGFSTLGGGGTGTTARALIGRLNADGGLDTDFDPGANNWVDALVVQPDGKILVGGWLLTLGGGGSGTTARSFIGRLNADGSLDTTFNPGANGTVLALAVQPDGKILVGGYFTTLGGGGIGATTRNYIGRLNADGSLDTNFNPGANGFVNAIAVQTDGKILVGGWFTTLGGGGSGTTTRNYIGRLNADGSLDTSFNPGANSYVYALAVQADGRILVAGAFTKLGGGGLGTTTRTRIARLNTDGSLDTSFDPGANSTVLALAVQPDGKILVGGEFTTLGGGGTGTTTRARIGRLNADGSLDISFNPGANNWVDVLAVQPDGKILVGGWFTTLGGGGFGTTARNFIGRLNADGSLDTSFDPGASGGVEAIAMQADGKILVGGDFTTLGGGGLGTTSRARIGRLNADGSLDTSFDPGANGGVEAIAMQADGKILVSGGFTTLGGGGTGTTTRNYIGRLTNTDAALQNLTVNTYGTTITWKRSGASPEVDRVTFELSTDGVTYAPLGGATRIPGGWQLTGLGRPRQQNIFIRARGFYSSGWFNGSGSIVEVTGEFSIEPGPTVAGINPASALIGSGAFILTVNGSSFVNGSIIQWNGSNRTTAFVNSTQLTAAITAADIASAGTVSVTVINPSPGGGTSNAYTFAITGPTQRWVLIGPTNGEAIIAWAFDPQNPITVYAATRSELLKSNNGGSTWSGVFDAPSGQIGYGHLSYRYGSSIYSLAIDPQNPNTVYVGIGSKSTSPAQEDWGSVYISIDGGASWARTGNSAMGPVSALAVDPQNPNTVYAGTMCGTSVPVHWGLYKSIDGGGSWDSIYNGEAIPFSGFSALAIDPQNPWTVYVILGGGVLKSGNGGDSWSAINNGLTTSGVSALTIQPQSSLTLYATTAEGLFKSIDGGASWSAINNGLTASAVYTLVVDPQYPMTVYAGTNGGVFKSIDGGTSWNAINNGLTTPFIGALAINPQNPTTVYAGTADGVFKLVSAETEPGPFVTDINPVSVIVGSGGFTLTVNGSRFVRGAVVRWNGSIRTTTFASNFQLLASISASDIASAGTAQVTVSNPDGSTSFPIAFTINNSTPTLMGMSPTSFISGGAAFTLTVNGTNFVSNSTLQWNGANRTTTYVSSTQLTAAITAADVVTAGTASVTVVNPPPGGGTSNVLTFTIIVPPTITSLSPTSMVAGGAAFTLTVNGTNFLSTSTVQWNGSNRATTFVNSTQLTATITAANIAPAGTARIVSV